MKVIRMFVPLAIALLINILQEAVYEVVLPARFLWLSDLLGLEPPSSTILTSYLTRVVTCSVAVAVMLALVKKGWSQDQTASSASGNLWLIILAVLISAITLLRGIPADGLVSLGTPNGPAEMVSQAVAIWLIYTLIGALEEEAVSREVTMSLLVRYGVYASVVLSSALFGMMHFGNFLRRTLSLEDTVTQMAQAMLFGVFAGALRLRMGSLTWTVLIHGIWNQFNDIGLRLYLAAPGKSMLALVSPSLFVFLQWLPYLLIGVFGVAILLFTKWPDPNSASSAQATPEHGLSDAGACTSEV